MMTIDVPCDIGQTPYAAFREFVERALPRLSSGGRAALLIALVQFGADPKAHVPRQ